LRTALLVAIALIVAGPISRSFGYLNQLPDVRHYATLSNADTLMVGCLAALLIRFKPSTVSGIVNWRPTIGRGLIFLVGIVGPILLEQNLIFGKFTVPFSQTVAAISFAYLICSYSFVRQGVIFLILNSRPAVFLGCLSYSIYIWQQPFFFPGAPLPFPVNIAAILAVASLSYYGLEQPLLGLRRRLRDSHAARRCAPPCSSTPISQFVPSLTTGSLFAPPPAIVLKKVVALASVTKARAPTPAVDADGKLETVVEPVTASGLHAQHARLPRRPPR
jgi:peptidoglycan/LPS O-acetylase OafA/YrhL